MQVVERFSFVVLVVSLLLPWTPGAWGQKAEDGDPRKGKEKYEQFCAVCHGKRGGGNGPMAKATTPPAPRLTTREIRDQSDEQLYNSIANGVGSAMPAWRGVLNDQQLVDVLAYVRALSG